MEALDKDLNKKRNEFGKAFVFSLLGIFLFYNILMFLIKVTGQPYRLAISHSTMFFSFVAIAYVAYLISKTHFEFWPVFKTVAATLFCFVFYITMLMCHRSMSICLFYIPITLIVLMLTSLRKAIICAILVLILCYFTPYLSEKLDISHPETYSKEYLEKLKYFIYLIMIIVAYLSFLILYYYNEFSKIELKRLQLQLIYGTQEKVEPSKKLYLEILEYMEIKKPYKNPEFTIKKMAKDLKTNQTYVSRALNTEGNKKFSTFLQEYRIREVKEALLKNEHKYTLEQIYKKAGFIHQATFNRIFKEMTGVTPSQYIDSLQK